jgi:imidazolonepropionase-like amidohydrolase
MIRILAGKLFDPYTLAFVTDQTITVNPSSGLITSVRDRNNSDYTSTTCTLADAGGVGHGPSIVTNTNKTTEGQRDLKADKEVGVEVEIVDLTKATVLPGFVDVHVHR